MGKWNKTESYDLMDVKESADMNGYFALIPKDNELQLDIDTKEAYDIFQHSLSDFQTHTKIFEGAKIFEKISQSGYPHKHIIITLKKDYSITERILFQLLLGSDFTRERLSFLRSLMGIENPLALFIPYQDEDNDEDNL